MIDVVTVSVDEDADGPLHLASLDGNSLLVEASADAASIMMERYQVPGAAVTVTTSEGTWSMEQGVTDLETQDPIDSDMVYC